MKKIALSTYRFTRAERFTMTVLPSDAIAGPTTLHEQTDEFAKIEHRFGESDSEIGTISPLAPRPDLPSDGGHFADATSDIWGRETPGLRVRRDAFAI